MSMYHSVFSTTAEIVELSNSFFLEHVTESIHVDESYDACELLLHDEFPQSSLHATENEVPADSRTTDAGTEAGLISTSVPALSERKGLSSERSSRKLEKETKRPSSSKRKQSKTRSSTKSPIPIIK